MYLMHADFVDLIEYNVFLCKKYIEITVYYDLISVCKSFVPRWRFMFSVAYCDLINICEV